MASTPEDRRRQITGPSWELQATARARGESEAELVRISVPDWRRLPAGTRRGRRRKKVQRRQTPEGRAAGGSRNQQQKGKNAY